MFHTRNAGYTGCFSVVCFAVWNILVIFALVNEFIMSGSVIKDIGTLLRTELRHCISRRDVSSACGLSTGSDRLYGYTEALSSAASSCLRYSDLDGMVYVFDGMIWRPLSDRMDSEYSSIVNSAVRDVLLWCCPSVKRGDLFNGESRLGKSILDGAVRNKMGVSPSVVGFQNGVWDFSDPLCPVSHSFSERLDIRSVREYDYDPGAVCPGWKSFLSGTVSAGDMDTLQSFFGLGVKPRTMLGHSVEKMLWLVGSGGNGKSTCLDTLEYVYGGDLFSHVSLPTLLDGNVDARMRGTAPAIGCRYNRCDEIQMSDITWKTDLLKRLCSADHVEYRRIKGNAMSSNEIPFFVFSMNRVPRSSNTDPALLRRLLIVRFGYSVRAEDMDTSLGERLRMEASGIWNWCLEGYRLLASRHFLFPRSVDNDIEQRKFLMSSGQQMDVWLSEEGLAPTGRTRLQKPVRVALSVLYDRYIAWCDRNGVDLDCENANVFSRVMATGMKGRAGHGFVKKRASVGMYFEVYSDSKIDYGF